MDMKKLVIHNTKTSLSIASLITICILFHSPLYSQQSQDARLNFAIPDAPAFKILDEDPSTIMRPTSVREVTAAVSDFVKSGNVLPNLFAVEFSPGMLIGGSSLTIQGYKDQKFLYRTRISAATHRLDEGSGGTLASIGVRVTFTDDSDPRLDDEFVEKLGNLAMSMNRRVASVVQKTRPVKTGKITATLVEDSTMNDSVNRDDLEETLTRLRAEQKDAKWNASIVEAGAAARYLSVDSLARNAVVNKYGGWFEAAFPVSQWGQFLFGIAASLERNAAGSFDSSSVAISGRIYFGSNDLKFFGEAQVEGQDRDANRLVRIGGEIATLDGFWLEFNGGLEKRGQNESTVATSFNIRWSLPEMFPKGDH